MGLSTFEKLYIIKFIGRYALPEYMPKDLRKKIIEQDDFSGVIIEKTKDKDEVKKIIKSYIEGWKFNVKSFDISMRETHKIEGDFGEGEKAFFSDEKTDLGRYEVSRYGIITTDEIKATYIDGVKNFLHNGKRAIRVPNYVLADIKEGKNNKYFKLYNTKVYEAPFNSQHYLVEPNHIPDNGPVDLPIEPIPYGKNFVDTEVNLIYKACENQR